MAPHGNTPATATPPNDDDAEQEDTPLTQAAHTAAGPGGSTVAAAVPRPPHGEHRGTRILKWAAILASIAAVGYFAWGAATPPHAAPTGGDAYLTDVIGGGGRGDDPHAVLKQQAAEAGVELTQEAMDKMRDAVRG